MDVKLLELRDSGTMMPVMAVALLHRNPAERFLTGRAGYADEQTDPRAHPNTARSPYVILVTLDGVRAAYDPYSWPGAGRTLPVAHQWIIDHWWELSSGDVVDVQFILRETQTPKQSERGAHHG